MSKRLTRILTVAVLVIVVVVAARQLVVAPDGFAAFRPTSASELAARPEAHLYFPGSVVLHESTYDMTGPLLSRGDDASITIAAATSASRKDVIAWYANQVQSRGWSPTCGEVCIPTAPEWSRGNRENFAVRLLDSTSVDYRSTNLPTEYVVDYWLSARLGVEELYCIVTRTPHYTGPPTAQRFLC